MLKTFPRPCNKSTWEKTTTGGQGTVENKHFEPSKQYLRKGS